MSIEQSDKNFIGSIPALYEEYLVPLIFDVYAEKMADKVTSFNPKKVLELAAGTGVATKALSQKSITGLDLTATDLNQDMLNQASLYCQNERISWQQADALELPCDANTFDLVMCQFGVMFFPDRVKAYREAARVLKPGGKLVFSVWDSLEHNTLAKIVTQSLAFLYPNKPPSFLARVPYAYSNLTLISNELEQAGFTENTEFLLEKEVSLASSSKIPAIAYCQGTPLRLEIEKLGSVSLTQATEYVSESIMKKLGSGPLESSIQAYLITATLL